MSLTYIIAILGGFAIELFFRAVKYHNISNDSPIPKYQPYNNYITVIEFVSSGNSRWLRYLLFRTLPPLVILVLTGAIYQKHFHLTNYMYYFFITILISLLPRDILQITKRTITISEKSVHIINVLSLLFICVVLNSLFQATNLSFLSPSLEGIMDNIWSSLFVALLLILYLDATNQHRSSNNNENSTRLNNFVVNSYQYLQQSFSICIEKSAEENNVSKPLLYAILIYENLNRPKFIRIIENIIVRVSHRTLSVGIAQVQSNLPLSDIESINIACTRLNNSNELFKSGTIMDIRKFILTYNGSEEYVESILHIIDALKRYSSLEF